MTAKERIIGQLDGLDEGQLAAVEKQIKWFRPEREADKQERIKRQLEALHSVAGMLSGPEDYAEFEKYARRRPLFGGRTLDLGPDEADMLGDNDDG